MDHEIWRTVTPRSGLTIRFRLTPNRRGRLVITAVEMEGDAITGEDFRKIRIGEIESQGMPEHPAPTAPLTRQRAGDAEAHARLVAEHYRYHAAYSPKPAKLMSDACGAPLQTVHNWIREARLRGLLPTAQRGKAG